MKVQFKLGYYGYIVDREDAVTLLDIFSRATDKEGEFVKCEIDKAPNRVREALEKDIKKESAEELAQFKKYWMDASAERDSLRNRIALLEQASE